MSRIDFKYLTIDYVKIEGGFVRNMLADERDRLIVQQINNMAYSFGLKTIAEYVEDEETAQMLAAQGVDYAQGFLAILCCWKASIYGWMAGK